MNEQTSKAINKRNDAVGHRETKENMMDYYFEIKSLDGRLHDVLDEPFPYLFYSVWITTNCKILKEMGIPDHPTCVLRNLYAGQEATLRTGHEMTDWFQIRKGVHEGCILSPCLFNLYAEYTMRNAGLDEAQAGIKIAERNINNLRHADDRK